MDLSCDHRVIMTLDAGGTSLRFSAMRGGEAVTKTITMPSNADNLDHCLSNIIEGFIQVKAVAPSLPVAISFAFPGPADYPNGVIGDLPNLPAFRGGIPLGPLLEEKFQMPVFINNDGDLFAYGEALAGLLPHVNSLLEKSGSPKRFKNLIGITLGTGFGGGIVQNGELFIGDNSGAGEVWLLRNKLEPQMNAEEGACIRAVRRVYAEVAGIPFHQAPNPRMIQQIALGQVPGNATAATEAYRRLGEVVGDALGNALTLVDGLAVIGGGLSNAWSLFMPRVVEELNSTYTRHDGRKFRRLVPEIFNLEDNIQLERFLQGDTRAIAVPGSNRKVSCDCMPRLGVGISKLGTSEAIAKGAYAFAINQLQK